jgi:uncharacterized protein YkwD
MSKHIIRRTGLDFDPDLSRRRVVSSAFLLLGAAGVAGCASGASTHAGRRARSEVPGKPIAFDKHEAFAKLNRIRRKHWLREFQPDPRLEKAAGDYANLMGERGLYGHEIGPGTDFRSRIFRVGFTDSAGENIGVGYGSIDEALQGWLDSPDHRKIMLRPNYTLAGIGYAFNTSGRNPRYTHFWVLNVGQGDSRYG